VIAAIVEHRDRSGSIREVRMAIRGERNRRLGTASHGDRHRERIRDDRDIDVARVVDMDEQAAVGLDVRACRGERRL